MNDINQPQSFAQPMNKLRQRAVVTTAFLFSAAVARAHPGHPLHESDLTHVLGSPYHLTILAAGGLALLAGGTLVQRRLPRQVLRTVGALMLLAAGIIGSLVA